jgi:DNA-binding beta-propeller fold protein YncE
VDDEGSIVVCDFSNSKVQIIDQEGNFYTPIILSGVYPTFVAVHHNGNILVATSDGKLLVCGTQKS